MPRTFVLVIAACALSRPSARIEAQPIPARRIVQETAAMYKRVPQFTMTATATWCADPTSAGCDFRNPASVRATPPGGLLASDFMGPLRLFDSTGAFIRELGRKGQGPGEYGFVVDAHVASERKTGLFCKAVVHQSADAQRSARRMLARAAHRCGCARLRLRRRTPWRSSWVPTCTAKKPRTAASSP